MTAARLARAALLAVAVAAGVTACTSSGSGSGAPKPSADPSGVALTSSTVASPEATTAPATLSPAAPAPDPTITPDAPPAAPATAAAASVAIPRSTVPSASTCTKVTVRVVVGGAAQGTEIAALQFTNAGPRSCRLGDFPSVTLLRDGRPVGAPAQPSTARAAALTLEPGEIAESLLHDYSTCQAVLSDSIRVTVPGERTSAIRPVQLRACTLRVDPLSPPS